MTGTPPEPGSEKAPDRNSHRGTTTAPGAEATKESDNVAAEEDEAANYPGPLALALLMFGISAASFMVALDRTIVATAIPRITDDFNSPQDVGWYGSGYLLVSFDGGSSAAMPSCEYD